MKYYFNKTIKGSYNEVLIKVTEALKTEGFGIVSEIRMNEKFKEKLNIDFRRYTILGACNPSFAYKAVQEEDKIGIMLPCNVVIQEIQPETYEIAIGDPIASMMSIDNEKLGSLASDVQAKLLNVYKKL
jgi:uncharacterized protein (DUF302 family)